jgi:hypothetical protein
VSPVENPEEREGFKYPDLLSHARANRCRYLADGLTIIRGYFAGGLPDPIKPLGSFESWTRIIVGAVQWATGFDPLQPRELVKTEDAGAQSRRNLFAGLAALDGIKLELTAAEIRKAVMPPKVAAGAEEKPSAHPVMYDALMEHAFRGEFPNTRTIGTLLRGLKDRVIEGYRLTAQEDKHKKVVRWSLAPADVSCGVGGVVRGVVRSGPAPRGADAHTHTHAGAHADANPTANDPATPRTTPQTDSDDGDVPPIEAFGPPPSGDS